MIYTKEVENMCPVAKGAKHEPAPIPEEGKWVHSKKIEDISGFTLSKSRDKSKLRKRFIIRKEIKRIIPAKKANPPLIKPII